MSGGRPVSLLRMGLCDVFVLLCSDNFSLKCRAPEVDYFPKNRKQQPLPLASATQELQCAVLMGLNGDAGKLSIYKIIHELEE